MGDIFQYFLLDILGGLIVGFIFGVFWILIKKIFHR